MLSEEPTTATRFCSTQLRSAWGVGQRGGGADSLLPGPLCCGRTARSAESYSFTFLTPNSRSIQVGRDSQQLTSCAQLEDLPLGSKQVTARL